MLGKPLLPLQLTCQCKRTRAYKDPGLKSRGPGWRDHSVDTVIQDRSRLWNTQNACEIQLQEHPLYGENVQPGLSCNYLVVTKHAGERTGVPCTVGESEGRVGYRWQAGLVGGISQPMLPAESEDTYDCHQPRGIFRLQYFNLHCAFVGARHERQRLQFVLKIIST